jgi:hypothetical protein
LLWRQALRKTIALAPWETARSSLTLIRGTYSPEFQLILISKPLSLSARTASREAIRLDAAEAPRRELDQRKKEAAEASAAAAMQRVSTLGIARDGTLPIPLAAVHAAIESGNMVAQVPNESLV